eukprot:1190570-Prorocentrum_minimum.AAC.2
MSAPRTMKSTATMQRTWCHRKALAPPVPLGPAPPLARTDELATRPLRHPTVAARAAHPDPKITLELHPPADNRAAALGRGPQSKRDLRETPELALATA